MTDPKALSCGELSDSAQRAVADLVVLLTGRFTGSIELDCVGGGVRNFREIRNRSAGDIGQLANKEGLAKRRLTVGR